MGIYKKTENSGKMKAEKWKEETMIIKIKSKDKIYHHSWKFRHNSSLSESDFNNGFYSWSIRTEKPYKLQKFLAYLHEKTSQYIFTSNTKGVAE